jgi:hypothetical protein
MREIGWESGATINAKLRQGKAANR